MVVVAGPRAPFLDPEKQALKDYLDRRARSSSWSIRARTPACPTCCPGGTWEFDDDLVIDPGRNYLGDALSILPSPQSGHRITTSLPDLILPGTRSVTVKPGAGSGFAIVPLLRTTERAWAEKNFTARRAPGRRRHARPPLGRRGGEQDRPDAGHHPRRAAGAGPVARRGAESPKGRIVVVGNSEFAANTYFGQVLGQPRLLRQQRELARRGGRCRALISIRATDRAARIILATSPRRWSCTPRS